MSRESIVRAISGPGKEIYEKMVKPQLKQAYQYDRVASYYSSNSLLILLKEFAQMWKRNGTIRLVIGFHERMDIIPVLKYNMNIENTIKSAIAKAMKGEIEQLAEILYTKEENILSVLRELINQKALSVRLVTPKSNFFHYKKTGKWPNPEIGTFHSKFMITHQKNKKKKSIRFRLRNFSRFFYRPTSRRKGEDYSVITCSLNESKKAYSENIEDAVLHRSWIDSENEVCEYFLNRFEKLWADKASDVLSMPFTMEFVEILKEIEKKIKKHYFTWKDFSETISNSSIYQSISLPYVGLLPHQIGVYREALSRWPIRVLLADEVGLGKTIEAGAIINYMMNHSGIKRIVILTPASLCKQWQKELKQYFNLDFWIYDSNQRHCYSDNDVIDVGTAPLSKKGMIDNVIMSWHWARIKAHDKIHFKPEDLPDLLIVDEAHHARIKDDGLDETKTQLYTLLKELQKSIPHIVLLTATPFQTELLDYYSLLDILGTPYNFKEMLYQFAKWTIGKAHIGLDTQVMQLKQIHQSLIDYNLKLKITPLDALLAFDTIQNTIFYEGIVRDTSNSEIIRNRLLTTHPSSFLTIRNYRSSLKDLGYGFPQAHYLGPQIKIDERHVDLLQDIEKYIYRFLGSYERNITSDYKIGLMRSLYRQRIVSSFKAAFDTLENRLEKLNKIIKEGEHDSLLLDITDEFSSSANDENDAMPKIEYKPRRDDETKLYIEKALTEKYHIEALLKRMEKIFKEDKIIDPKLEELVVQLKKHISKEHKILVFSRFTSTTGAILERLEEFIDKVGLGRFDGQCVGIYKKTESGIELEICGRTEIVENLKKGIIKILVCSDAASEGLNLHYANVVINVDVPWNPSRLQQRFGRVDRLGQKANDVYLINLYYPNSIEERMYRVLESRRKEFRSVLGEVPEIMSQQQKKIISDLSNNMSPIINLSLSEINQQREEIQKYKLFGIKTVDKEGSSEHSIYSSLIACLKKSAIKSGKTIKELDPKTLLIDNKRISVNPLDDDFISFGCALLRQFESPLKEGKDELMLHQLEDKSGNPLSFVLIKNDELKPIATKDWFKLFEFIFNGKPIDIKSLQSFSNNNLNELFNYIKETESWLWIDHDRIKCISSINPTIPMLDELQIGKELGYITVINN